MRVQLPWYLFKKISIFVKKHCDKNPEADTEKHVGIHVAALHRRATMKSPIFD